MRPCHNGRMSYLVLARKWRPKRFAELVGQEHVVRALTNALVGAGVTRWLMTTNKILEANGNDIIGNRTRIKVVKNKIAPPFKQAEFDIMFGEGISRSGEIIDLGAELGVIKKSGSWYSYNETKLGQGRDAAKQCVSDNPELAEELEKLIFEKMQEGK